MRFPACVRAVVGLSFPLLAFFASVASSPFSDDAVGYTRQDTFLPSEAGFDLFVSESSTGLFDDESNPQLGTLQDCAAICDGIPECAGFSRAKEVAADDVEACWFKHRFPLGFDVIEHEIWETFKKDEGWTEVCSGDCSGQAILGSWRQTTTTGSWSREDMQFNADCSTSIAEYEGSFLQASGCFRVSPSDPSAYEASFVDISPRTLFLDGQGGMTFTSASGVTVFSERTGGAPVTNCGPGQSLSIDRIGHTVVPPAGVQVRFRVLDCERRAVRPLAVGDVQIINDEKGEPFGLGGEGGSVSDLAPPSSFALLSVLALDMSDSIHNAGAVGDVIDGAKQFVDAVVRAPEPAFKHHVAIVAFGRPDLVELFQDFSNDPNVLDAALDSLALQPSRGTTDLYGAYMKALNLVQGSGDSTAYYEITSGTELIEQFVVVLTDGTHEAGDEENRRSAALALKESSPEVEIFALGIQGSFDQEKLIELATSEENYLEASVAGELSAKFDEVSQTIEAVARSNYVVGVCTPVALGNPTLTLQVDVDGKSASYTIPYSVDQLTGDLSSCDAAAIAAATGPGGG